MARSLDLEDSIADSLQRRGQLPQPAPQATGVGLDSKQLQRAARSSGKRLGEVCDAIAAEIQETGQSVVNIANTIAAESDALAELLHKHGSAIEARIEQFMSMSDRGKIKMPEAQGDMLGTSGTAPALGPRGAHNED